MTDDTELNPSQNDGYKELRKKIVPLTENDADEALSGQPEYKIIKDSIVFAGMPVGVYMVKFLQTIRILSRRGACCM